MTHQRFKTALVGFGKMASGYASDPLMAKHYPYAAHAQVLRDHDKFEWLAVVDPSPEARRVASEHWGVPHVAEGVAALGETADLIEVAVLATPPDARLALLDGFKSLRAVIVEKPLGMDLASSKAFLDECRRRGILVQVNLWRRADRFFRSLSTGRLKDLVGDVQSATFLYGNGVLNNGTHMVDFARMLFGEISAIQHVGAVAAFVEGPIPDDDNPSFILHVGPIPLYFTPLRFSHYRENGVVVWGSRGRLDILNEGLTILHYPVSENRAMTGEREIAADEPIRLESTVGYALFEMFSDVADSLSNATALASDGDSALTSASVIDAVRARGMSVVAQPSVL